MKNLLYVAVALFTLCLFTVNAIAGTPSSKAAAAVGNLVDVVQTCAVTAANPEDCMEDTGWITIQRMIIKTPNQKDLAIDSALQCALLTSTTVRSKDGVLDGAKAGAGIDVRIRVTDVDGNSLAEIPDSERFATPGEVTYCERAQTLSAQLTGYNCYVDTSNLGVPQDPVICQDPEVIMLELDTLAAHAFNFLAPNEIPGVKKIEVQARARALAELFGSKAGAANSSAVVGLGSTLVETIRLIKGADGTNVVIE